MKFFGLEFFMNFSPPLSLNLLLKTSDLAKKTMNVTLPPNKANPSAFGLQNLCEVEILNSPSLQRDPTGYLKLYCKENKIHFKNLIFKIKINVAVLV